MTKNIYLFLYTKFGDYMYIEELIILNVCIDYILLKSLSSLMKLQTNNFKILLSCLIGLIYLIIPFDVFIFKFIIMCLMIYVCFGFIDIRSFIKNIIYYFIISFFLGGIMYYIQINTLYYYKYFLLLIPIIMNIYEYFEYSLKQYIKFRYKVNIYLNDGNILYLNGFLDTGNNLIEPYSNRRVIIINKDVCENFYYVPYKTVGGEHLIKCFNPKRVYIDGIGDIKNISVGVIDKKFDGYNCLLNNLILEDI